MRIRFYYKILATTLLSILAVTGNLQAQSTETVSPDPVELFSINFDLSPETAVEVGETRFGCTYYNNNNICYLKGTALFTITQKKGMLSSVKFFCASFDGCSYSDNEIVEALAAQKSLVFDGNCTITELGAEICVQFKDITMRRSKFRVPELNFD